MNPMRKYLLLLLALTSLCACHRQVKITGVSTETFAIDAQLDPIQDQAYLQALEPTREALDREMNVQIGYAPERMWVNCPECPMLNWSCDALWEAAKRLCPKPVDMSVVNMGGMRCEWPAGPITRGHVFELMPFDNTLVVLTLTGRDILDLCQSFVDCGAQGVAGLRMTAVDGRLGEVTIGGKAVQPEATYTVATSNYLAGGADHMDALTRYVDIWNSDYVIRDLYLEAVQRQDTVRGVVDGRMNIR